STQDTCFISREVCFTRLHAATSKTDHPWSDSSLKPRFDGNVVGEVFLLSAKVPGSVAQVVRAHP
ncbi:hypothetical protein, partial [Dyella japonica]|uniref:hypothetical protein n=1 Tax=Dyella japonica TaxID=231455 RepID=UPI001B8087C8